MKTFKLLLLVVLSTVAWADVPNEFQAGTPAIADQVNQNFNDLDARIEENASNIALLDNEMECDTASVSGWWTFSQTDGRYSVVCVGYVDEGGISEADVSFCEVADRGSDDDNYVVNDNLTMVMPSVFEGSWTVVQEPHGCVVNGTYSESRGVTTIKANIGRHGDSLAGWGQYPQGDLFGITGIRTSKLR
jgi:hypothetical protein